MTGIVAARVGNRGATNHEYLRVERVAIDLPSVIISTSNGYKSLYKLPGETVPRLSVILFLSWGKSLPQRSIGHRPTPGSGSGLYPGCPTLFRPNTCDRNCFRTEVGDRRRTAPLHMGELRKLTSRSCSHSSGTFHLTWSQGRRGVQLRVQVVICLTGGFQAMWGCVPVGAVRLITTS